MAGKKNAGQNEESVLQEEFLDEVAIGASTEDWLEDVEGQPCGRGSQVQSDHVQ